MLSAFGMLPLVTAWVALLLLFRDLSTRGLIANHWAMHWAFASVAWGTLLAITVEALSLFGLVTGPALLIAWLLIDTVLVFFLIQRRDSVVHSCKQGLTGLRRMCAEWPRDATIMFVMAGAIVVFAFAIALFTPTTNWDSLTYHLPRMLHWLQQGAVDHFPTNNFRQVQFAPWASYALMHLFVFTGTDQFLNLMQWTAMLSTMIVVACIASSLARWAGLSVDLHSAKHVPQWWRTVAFTCLVVVTIPIGIIESTTTQNDYVVTFWLCCALCFALALMEAPRNPLYAAGMGGALGLATLTKSTAFLYAAPFIVAFGVWWLFRLDGMARRLRVAGAVCSIFALLNSGHMLRNHLATGSPLGAPQIFKLERNEALTLGVASSNLIRNLALNSNSGLAPVTRFLNRGLEWAHGLTGMDLNDAATTYHGCRFFFREKFIVTDSYTSNTWHLLLFAAAAVVSLRRLGPHSKLLLYPGLIIAGFLLFCLYLKWQWWHSRLHLAFLVLAAPYAGLVLAQNLPRHALLMMGALLSLFAGFSYIKNQSRPILSAEFRNLPREKKYMAIDGPHLSAPLALVADAIVASEGKRIGLNLPFDAAEYPLWMMLRSRGFAGRIEHVGPARSDHDVVVGSGESPWPTDRAVYRYSRNVGYYAVHWKEQPAFLLESASRQEDDITQKSKQASRGSSGSLH